MAFWRRKKKTPQEYMASGDFKGAIKAFKELIKEKGKGTDPVILLQLANALLKVKETAEAKKIFIKVGTYYGDRGFFNKSVAAFKKALNISPDDQGILEKLAEYNDKVPKFMIDERLLKRVEKKEQERTPEPEVEEAPASEPPAAEAPAPVPENDGSEDVTDPNLAEPPEENTQEVAEINEITEQKIRSISGEKTAEIDRKAVMALAKKEAEAKQQEESVDEEVFDLSDMTADVEFSTNPELPDPFGDAEEEFPMDFGDAKPVEPETQPLPKEPPPQPEATPEPAVAKAVESEAKGESENKFDQPISRGGMVFKTQKENKAEAKQESGFFNSFDDALDNLFDTGPEGGGGGIFDNLEPQTAAAGGDMASDGDMLFMSDATYEENQKHWALFRTMPQEVFMDFVIALETRDYMPGEDIVHEGDEGSEMFLIADGVVDVVVKIKGEPTHVASLGEGDFFGEASLLTGAPRNASCMAKEFTSCLVLNREDLNKLTENHPSVMSSIKNIYYARMEENASRAEGARE